MYLYLQAAILLGFACFSANSVRYYYGFDSSNPGRAECIPTEYTKAAYKWEYFGDRSYDEYGRPCVHWYKTVYVRTMKLDNNPQFTFKYPVGKMSDIDEEFPKEAILKGSSELRMIRGFYHNFCRRLTGASSKGMAAIPFCFVKNGTKPNGDDDFDSHFCFPQCNKAEAVYQSTNFAKDEHGWRSYPPGMRSLTIAGEPCLPWFVAAQKYSLDESKGEVVPAWKAKNVKAGVGYAMCRSIDGRGAEYSHVIGPVCFSPDSTIGLVHCYYNDYKYSNEFPESKFNRTTKDLEFDIHGCIPSSEILTHAIFKRESSSDAVYHLNYSALYSGFRRSTVSGKRCHFDTSDPFDWRKMCLCVGNISNKTTGYEMEDTRASKICKKVGLWCNTSASGEWEQCFETCETKQIDARKCVPDEMLKGDGYLYAGLRNYTVSGKACLTWTKESLKGEWLEGREDLTRVNFCRNSEKKQLPKCHVAGTTAPENCFYSCSEMDTIERDESFDCLTEDNYNSKLVRRRTFTLERQTCRRWDDPDIVASIGFTPSQFGLNGSETLSAAENFCANPDESASGPWCVPFQRDHFRSFSGDEKYQRQSCYNYCDAEEGLIEAMCRRSDDDLMRGYSGTKNRTMFGASCILWQDVLTALTKSEKTKITSGIRNIAEHKNHCRNPDGLSFGPYCYVRKDDHSRGRLTPDGIVSEPCFETCKDRYLRCVRIKDRGRVVYFGARNRSSTLPKAKCFNWHPDNITELIRRGDYIKPGRTHNFCRNIDYSPMGPSCCVNAACTMLVPCFKFCTDHTIYDELVWDVADSLRSKMIGVLSETTPDPNENNGTGVLKYIVVSGTLLVLALLVSATVWKRRLCNKAGVVAAKCD